MSANTAKSDHQNINKTLKTWFSLQKICAICCRDNMKNSKENAELRASG